MYRYGYASPYHLSDYNKLPIPNSRVCVFFFPEKHDEQFQPGWMLAVTNLSLELTLVEFEGVRNKKWSNPHLAPHIQSPELRVGLGFLLTIFDIFFHQAFFGGFGMSRVLSGQTCVLLLVPIRRERWLGLGVSKIPENNRERWMELRSGFDQHILSLGINRHILRYGQSPPKRIVCRFHYHSQELSQDP